MRYITKTIYLEYLACAKNIWLKMYKPELLDMFELSAFEKSLTANGNLVETWARKLFPGGILISSFGEAAEKETKSYLDQKRPVIFQATFIKNKFLVRNDVLEYDKDNDYWNLYEIKGTNKLNEKSDENDHIEDASFQYVVMRDAGIKIGKLFIIHLNKDYVRGDEININELFTFDDITQEVQGREKRTREKMTKATELLLQQDEKALECQCVYLGRSKHCTTFSYSHPEVPKYSVHDLSRIGNSKKKLAELVDLEIFDLNDVPDKFKLSYRQRNQVDVHKSRVPIIDVSAIQSELALLQYPLYFFDYETYPSAIPLFKGYRPYQHIPFQFSLHVLNSPNGKLDHFEYLHLEPIDPTDGIISALKKMIGPEGSIIVWNKMFEKGRNIELSERSPADKDFLKGLNKRIYDLMIIFQKQMYLHPDFKGSASIKQVLPIFAPHLSYKDLDIQEGGTAMDAWFSKIFNSKSETERELTAQQLLKYCELDTYAMYAIWEKLVKL